MIKVYDFVISDFAQEYKKEHGKENNSVPIKEMEKIINKIELINSHRCYKRKSYTS